MVGVEIKADHRSAWKFKSGCPSCDRVKIQYMGSTIECTVTKVAILFNSPEQALPQVHLIPCIRASELSKAITGVVRPDVGKSPTVGDGKVTEDFRGGDFW